MSKDLNVVHCVLSLEVGGLERVVIDLVREGVRHGQRVAVAVLERRGELFTQAESLGAKVIEVGKKDGLRPGTIRRMAIALDEFRPDIVHTHQVSALAYAGPAMRVRGGAVLVHTEHGKHYRQRFRTRLLGRIAAVFAARFFCVSKDIAAEVEACRVAPRRKVHVVPNGIDTARLGAASAQHAAAARAELGVPAGAPLVGTIGRMYEVKRQDRLVKAFARVLVRAPKAHLVLVGDGPLRGDLACLAGSLGMSDRVHFTGYQDRPERLLGAMDVFALTSRSEGMPLSVLEAWAAGVPVVASRVGGLPELIEDGRNGLLFEQDDEEALTAAIRFLIADPEFSRRLGEEGRREVVDRFDVRVMSEAYERHYRDLLAWKRAI